MIYNDLQREFARYGFSNCPITVDEFTRLSGQGFSLNELYAIGCDVASGFNLADAITANHDNPLDKPYTWQSDNANNHNHYIVEIYDKINPQNSYVWSQYYDGTQDEALQYFFTQDTVTRYIVSPERYRVVVKAKDIELNTIDKRKLPA